MSYYIWNLCKLTNCSVQFSSVTQSCPTLCDATDCSTPRLPVHHQLLELTQTQVHWVGDAIKSSHPLSFPSPPAFNFSQHQGPDNHDGVITHLEPDILECEVKWAFGSITMNKASGGGGIPVELFQILKMMLWKCCTQYGSKFGKLSSCHRTGKGQFSLQSQRKTLPKDAQTTIQLHSSHMLAK